MQYTQVQLDTILAEHKLWTAGMGGKRAYLRGANLRGAYLAGANLAGANLEEANLREGVRYLRFGPVGSRGDELIWFYGPDKDEAHAGCWTSTLADLEVEVTRVHGDNQHGQEYRRVIALFRAESQERRE